MQAFAERGPEDGAGDDDLVTQLRSRRNMLGDLIAAKDLQVRHLSKLGDEFIYDTSCFVWQQWVMAAAAAETAAEEERDSCGT
jgi:hypothetical protein